MCVRASARLHWLLFDILDWWTMMVVMVVWGAFDSRHTHTYTQTETEIDVITASAVATVALGLR